MRKVALLAISLASSGCNALLANYQICPRLTVYPEPALTDINAEPRYLPDGRSEYVLQQPDWDAVGSNIGVLREMIERFQKQADTVNRSYEVTTPTK